MATTSDGITASDWDRVHELALAIVNTDEASHEERHRSHRLNYLDELTAKYGELPSLLATRADYVQDPAESERLLLRAFEAATRTGDTLNLREVALSLADLYTSERPRHVAARVWLDKARAYLSPDNESGWAELRRIEKRLNE
jgi:hypothetical protein